MKDELTIRISGEAGQGMQTVGMALCSAFKGAGYRIFANQDYMSRIRGGHNFFQLRISNKPIYALRAEVDISVALNKQSVAINRESLAAKGIVVLDAKKYGMASVDEAAFFDVPLYDLAQRAGGSEIFVNSVACGVIAGMMRLDFSRIANLLGAAFAGKDAVVIKNNIEAAKAGYESARTNFKRDTFMMGKPQGSGKQKLLMNGNDAIALGAIAAGCKFYSAYPMTPSTSIMNVMAEYAKRFGIVVEQAEDEIAAINMVIGASYAGVRSMTGTSGGGFALMTEGLSLAGMTETPIVIVDAQRPAPATGFPTRTEQADLDFVLHAGHGEFTRAVYAPGTIEEAFYLTVKAFNTAEKYQIPVIIMTDQHLADSYRDIAIPDQKKAPVKRYIISKKDSAAVKGYKRYALTESGISPRAVPSWIDDLIYADSDEHTEEGHITEDADTREKMVEKRFHKRMRALAAEVESPVTVNIERADHLLVGFGSTYGVLKEAAETLASENVGFIHLPQVWPFPSDEVEKLLRGRHRVVTVENNAGGQLAKLIRRETGIKVSGSILKYDGRPFSLDLIRQRLSKGIYR